MTINGTALIIDDNKFNVESLAALLKVEGLETVSIQNPQLIFPTLDEVSNIRVIFLDIGFPNHSGFQILPLLQIDSRLRCIPIVAYTVHTHLMQEIRDAGFNSFLGKPISAVAFPDQLRRILNKESIWEFGY